MNGKKSLPEYGGDDYMMTVKIPKKQKLTKMQNLMILKNCY